MGWAQRRRDLGNLIFVWLRDRTGIVQVVFDASDDAALFAKAEQIRSEYCLAVTGEVKARTPENVNPALKTGTFEAVSYTHLDVYKRQALASLWVTRRCSGCIGLKRTLA